MLLSLLIYDDDDDDDHYFIVFIVLTRWGIIFSHPADYTPVCTTETARVIELVPEFKKRNVKLIDISCDSVDDHLGWCKVRPMGTGSFNYPCCEMVYAKMSARSQ